MNKKPTIFIDMDNTTLDLIGPWIKNILDVYGQVPTHMSTFDLNGWYPTLTRKQTHSFLEQPGVFSELKPFPNALDTIKQWHTDGFDVWFATVVPIQAPDVYKQKHTWIMNNIPELAEKVMTFSSHDKTKIAGDILIDDHPSHITDAINVIPIVYDQPWNKNGLDGRCRAENWLEVDRKVRKLCAYKGLV